MALLTGADLISDILFRAGEIPGSSEWDEKVVDYLNRVYSALCAGSSEFLPEYVEDWWWMRDTAVLILDPIIDTGTVSVTVDSAIAVFTDAPTVDVTGWRFKVDGHPDNFVISSIAGNTATLDSVYTGDTNSEATYELLHTEYTLSNSVQAIMSPIVSFRDNPQLMGTTPERMDFLFPLSRLQSGVPKAFSLEDDRTVRFSHGGRTDGVKMRMEYRFRPAVTALENSGGSIPLVPAQYRHLLADMALVYVYNDKNDDRLQSAGSSARAGLIGMVKENRRRLTKIDQFSGAIVTRQSQARNHEGKLLRTETGLIIG